MIGLVTYKRPHRKTWDIASRLYLLGYKVTFLFVDWRDFGQRHPLVQHRPDMSISPDPFEISKAYRWKAVNYGKEKGIDLYVIGGSQYVKDMRALNVHPAYLPYVCGLDAVKWAIYEGFPVGVSVHWTTNELDGGRIVYRKFVPLYFEDTFHSFAFRAYEMEIQALLDVIRSPDLHDNDIEEDDSQMDWSSKIMRRRMKPYQERVMLERFEERRKKAHSVYEYNMHTVER